ncbi:MAG: hypothetical protein AB4352_02240 [Hormoscilla sp.]
MLCIYCPTGCDRQNYVGARHQQVIGEDENVITAVPRPHAIAQCHVRRQHAIAAPCAKTIDKMRSPTKSKLDWPKSKSIRKYLEIMVIIC